MKKILLSALLIGSVTSAYSQYFTVKLGGGYSVPGIQQSTGVLTFQPGSSPDPANSAIIPLVSYNTSTVDTTRSRYKSNVYSGYGHGGHFDFAFGYMITPYFGVQIDGAYLWGSTVQASQTTDDNVLLGANTNIMTKTHSNGLSLNPSLVFRAAKATAKVAPYARVGLALPIAGAIYHDLHITTDNFFYAPNTPTTADIGVKTTATVSLGMQGCVGVSYTPIPLISVWGELNGQYLFVKAKQAMVTSYTIDVQGKATENMLGTNNTYNGGKPYSTYSQVINFVDQINTSSNTTDFGKYRDVTGTHTGNPAYVNENQAHDELRQVANLGSFGFTVGVTFNMSKKIFKDPLGKKAKEAAAK